MIIDFKDRKEAGRKINPSIFFNYSQLKIKNIVLLLCASFLFFGLTTTANAASRYWVGGCSTTDWNCNDSGVTNWGSVSNTRDNASVPNGTDDVIFDGVGVGASNSTLSANITIQSLNMTGYVNTLTHNTDTTLTVSGNVTFSSGMTYILSNALTSALTITATSNLTSNGKTIGNFTYNKSDGTLTLIDNLTSSGNFFLQAGTLAPGTNTVTLNGVTPTITPTVPLTFYNLNITPASPTKLNSITLSGNIVVSNMFTVSNGATVTNRVLVTSNTLGTPRTITANAISISNADFRDITGAGSATWDLSNIAGGSGNAGGNSMKALGDSAFTTAQQQFWTGETGTWSNATQWCISSGGCADNAGNGRVPLPQDDVIFDNGSFSGTGKIVTVDMPRLGRNINWSGYNEGQNPTWSGATPPTIYGSLTLISGMTFTQPQNIWFEGRASGMPTGGWTLTSAGKNITRARFYINMYGGTLKLLDDLDIFSDLSLIYGTFNANNFNVIALSGFNFTTTGTKTLNMGSGTWTITGTGTVWNANKTVADGFTINAQTSTIIISNTSSTAKTFAGSGDQTYNNITFSGDNITVTNNNNFVGTFAVNNAGLPTGLLLQNGTTQTINSFTTNATTTSARAIIKSTNTAAATIAKYGGTIGVDYMNPSWITGTPGSTWYFGSNSLNGGNNSGLTFTNPPISTKAITAFDFNGLSPVVTGVVDAGSHTIALTVPFGTDVTSLVPTITITGASISPNTGVAQNFSSPVTYTVTAHDNTTQNYVVTVTVAANPAKAITAFNFNGLSPVITGVVNEGSHTIALNVPFGTNVTALVPTITITGASVSPNTSVARNFSSPVTYTVTAVDTTTQNYVVTVTVADPVIENLGVQFQTVNYSSSFMFLDGSGNKHWFGAYDGITTNINTQFFDVNMTTGATNYFDTGKGGRVNVYGKAVSGNKLYIGTNDPGYLWEYDITAGTYTQRSAPGWTSTNYGLAVDKTAQIAYTATDGMVYFGIAVRGTVFKVNPSTGTVTDFGVIDAPDSNPTCSGCYRYVYTLAADTNYVYVGMRDANTNYWWLSILNASDGSLSASCWKNDGLTSGIVRQSLDGTQIWYSRNGGDYRIDNTSGACPTTAGTMPSVRTPNHQSNVYFSKNDSNAQTVSLFGVDIDDSDASADTGTSGLTTIRYRNPSGSGSYTTKTQLLSLGDAPLKRIKTRDSTNAYLVNGAYGPDALFNGNSSTMLGRIAGQSTYAITTIEPYVYFSGYSSSTFRWTPASPWTLTGTNQTNCSASSPSNPCLAVSGWSKYHYYSVAASDGLLYVASNEERGTRAGGTIGWLTPSTGATGSLAFNCDAPKGFALLSDGKTIAYSSLSEDGSFGCTNTEGKLFIFNTETHTTTATLTPVATAPNQGTIVATNDGGLLGIIKDFPVVGHYTVYKGNSVGQHASWSPMEVTGNIFGASASYDRRIVVGRNGYAWTWNTTGVVRINPTTGSITTYATLPGITYLELVGEDLYIAVDTILYKINDVDPDPSTAKAITAFNFNGLSPVITGVVNEGSHTIALNVPFGTNVTALVPTITITGASVSPNTSVARNFSSPVTYTVTAENNTTQTYTVTVTISPHISSSGSRPGYWAYQYILNKNIVLSSGSDTTSEMYKFKRNLYLSSTGTDVRQLQKYLNANGFIIAETGAGSLGKETFFFGRLTYKALVKFQKSIGWSGTGFFGPMTREYINNH